jgi:VanZ family protein
LACEQAVLRIALRWKARVCFHPGVFQQRVFAKYWLPILLWMLLIYSGSGNLLSSQQTSRLLKPLMHWLFPSLPEASVDRAVGVIRKGGHVAEYAVLALLFWRARRRPTTSEARPWVWRDASWAFALAVAYAATDELHQAFVPSRTGSGWDVLLDASGAAAALLLLWGIGRWQKWW